MTPIVGKRARTQGQRRPRKRQRVDLPKDATATQKAPDTGVSLLDELAWKSVALPDRLDDAEGFFGLEEIEDVEVIKDDKSGKIEYRPIYHSGKDRHLADSGSDTYGHKCRTNYSISLKPDEDSWEGFEVNGDNVESTKKTLLVNKQAPKKVLQKIAKKSRQKDNLKSDKTGVAKRQDESLGNEFDVLSQEEHNLVDVSAWQSLELSPETLSSLSKLKFASPTPIQVAAIPDILHGHDVVGKASTGSGKTLAFGIPILEHYLTNYNQIEPPKLADNEDSQQPPLAMILSPTRELAHQLSTHLTDLFSSATTNCPRIATVTGGLSLQKQQRLLLKADVIIGTPGRLWEVIQDGHGFVPLLRKIKFLVVDEADRLLSEGHFKEVKEILNVLDRTNDGEDNEKDGNKPGVGNERQTLVFSATFQKDLQRKLAGRSKASSSDTMSQQESMEYLLEKLKFREEKPKFIDVNPVSQMASGLKEGIVECAGPEKDLYLYALLLHHPNKRTLIFTNSIHSVRRLFPFLQNLSLPALALHSQMPQKARLRSIERFSSPSAPASILIATDVAARGLDIPSVQLVVHYHLPRAADTYVHRSGRTARAEKEGSSILLCAPEEVQGVRRLVAKVHARNASLDNQDKAKQFKFFMRTIELDRRVVARLRPRVTLSKTISDALLAKEKKSHEDNWLRTAADDLGVEYDSEEFAAGEGGKMGRGHGRKKAESEARALSKAEVGALKAELKGLLAQRVNVGVSERYLTAGGVDVEELLSGNKGEFLGRVDGIEEDLCT